MLTGLVVGCSLGGVGEVGFRQDDPDVADDRRPNVDSLDTTRPFDIVETSTDETVAIEEVDSRIVEAVDLEYEEGPEPLVCDPITNFGCATDQNCTLIAENTLGCVTAGTAGYGEECSQSLPCRRGACLTLDGEVYTCRQYCRQTDNQCPDERPCNVIIRGTDYRVCGEPVTTCDILQQDCPQGQGCYLASVDGQTRCADSGGIGLDQPCTAGNDCEPGLVCGGPEGGQGRCLLVCDLGAAEPACAEDQACYSIGVSVLPNVGVCD